MPSTFTAFQDGWRLVKFVPLITETGNSRNTVVKSAVRELETFSRWSSYIIVGLVYSCRWLLKASLRLLLYNDHSESGTMTKFMGFQEDLNNFPAFGLLRRHLESSISGQKSAGTLDKQSSSAHIMTPVIVTKLVNPSVISSGEQTIQFIHVY